MSASDLFDHRPANDPKKLGILAPAAQLGQRGPGTTSLKNLLVSLLVSTDLAAKNVALNQ